MISICSQRDVWGIGYTPSFHICCNVGLNENPQRYCGFLLVHHHDKVLVTVDKGDKDDDVVLLCAWGGGGYMLSLLCLGELHSELPTVEKCTFLSKYLYGQRPSSAFTWFVSFHKHVFRLKPYLLVQVDSNISMNLWRRRQCGANCQFGANDEVTTIVQRPKAS